jgi:4-hydroxy-tetrahydrodipicolinate reductase
MNIAIFGNGKMGKKISKFVTNKGHHITCIADSKKPAISFDLSTTDVAIDFSTPNSAFENITHAINSGTAVVSGTTGWLDNLEKINEFCARKGGSFLHSNNFSLGINIFFELNKKLARLMKDQDYTRHIHEIHHTQKIDSPSGTAISLEEQIDKILYSKTKITSDRINNTTGTHQITYSSIIDEIKIKHTANNRDGFAIGAIIAAEWLNGKKGVYSMQDMLSQ